MLTVRGKTLTAGEAVDIGLGIEQLLIQIRIRGRVHTTAASEYHR
jgi:hypothetical protein